MPEAVIVEAVRTPVGRHGGALKDVRPDDLAALVLREVTARARLDPAEIEEVYLGCANQAGEDNRNVARMATLLAGLPLHIPGITVNRLCSSGLSAIIMASQMIKSGAADIVIAGGVESMSREAPPKGNSPTGQGRHAWRSFGPGSRNPTFSPRPLDRAGSFMGQIVQTWAGSMRGASPARGDSRATVVRGPRDKSGSLQCQVPVVAKSPGMSTGRVELARERPGLPGEACTDAKPIPHYRVAAVYRYSTAVFHCRF